MKTFITITLMTLTIALKAQFYTWNGKQLILDNGMISRVINYHADSMKWTSKSMLLKGCTNNFLEKESEDFSFLIDEKQMNGFSQWKFISCQAISDEHEGKGAKIILSNEIGIEIELHYLLYPNMPVIRKSIKIKNTGEKEIKIESLNIEFIRSSLFKTNTQVYHNYARMRHLGEYTGNWDDPMMMVHDVRNECGIAIGNESPGVLKRSAYHYDGASIEAGLSFPGQDFPFRKWLSKGEQWQSPAVFIAAYQSNNPNEILNGMINNFVRKHLDFRIIGIEEKPVFVYNTWYPFRTFVSDTLVRSLAKAAAECGVQEFVIDDGWQINIDAHSSDKAWGGNYGDWQVDENKFPGGLKPTFDYIRSLGMKPGLWISIGSVTDNAKVYKDHPEWVVKNYKGKDGNLHFVSDSSDFYTTCLATDWVEYIKDAILRLVKEHGLVYAKLDLSVVASAYVEDLRISGCYATNHPYHKDREESFIVIYEKLLKLFEDLHREAPDLFIDCTFETAGKLQLMDYAIAQYADGNWLANFEEPYPIGTLRIRQMAWWRSPAIPASSLVIGNTKLDDKYFESSLKSLIGTLPIVLGDPRKLSVEQRKVAKQWSLWMQSMQKKYDYMSFRSDLQGFGEPQEGAWDGWQRINNDNHKGGIVGVFRQGAKEDKRRVFLSGLDETKKYSVLLAPMGKLIITTSGKELMDKGFEVSIPALYDGVIFEVRVL